MRTAVQGTFDGLCGVYAVLNALDPAGYRLRRGQIHADLFKELVYGLGSVALLSAMHDGLDRRDLMRAAKAAFRWLALEHGVYLTIEAPYAKRPRPSLKAFKALLGHHLIAPREAVILYLHTPRRDHWTVPVAILGQELQLRDSSGTASLPFRPLFSATGKVRVSPHNTLIVRLRDEPALDDP